MNPTTKRTRPQRTALPAQHVYLPHSSWARVQHKPTSDVPIGADDFWARLGL